MGPAKRVSARLQSGLATAARDVLGAAAVEGREGYRSSTAITRVKVPEDGPVEVEATAIIVPAPDSPDDAREVMREVLGAVLAEVGEAHGELAHYETAPGRKGPLQ